MLTKFEICYIFKSSGKGTDKKQFIRGYIMELKRFTEIEIMKNIISKAKEEGKALEGVYFSNKEGDNYSFCLDKLSIIANLMSDDINHITYFKCTKTGKFTTHNF